MYESPIDHHRAAQPLLEPPTLSIGTRSGLLLLIALVLSLLTTPTTTAHAGDTAPGKVYNGVIADIADLPSVVLVDVGGGQCTGTVIASTWVLTAAHCFDGGATEATVFIGFDARSDLDEGVASQRVVMHPDYDANTWEADIALIELSLATDAPPQALSASGAASPIGSSAVITGWGLQSNNPDVESDNLRRGAVTVVDCEGNIDPALAQVFVCAGSDTQDVCEGDSGGPLLAVTSSGLVQVGLVSHGEACDQNSSLVGIYASVSHYRGWVDATIVATDVAPGPFNDVSADSVHAPGITAVRDAGIAAGVGGGNFAPGRDVTREQMASFLARALELDIDPDADPGFPDVIPGTTHAGAIAAIREFGVTQGLADGTFNPTGTVTRAQMATFLALSLWEDFDEDADSGFPDVTPGTTHAGAIAAILDAGITEGRPDGTFDPSGNVTRAAMATFLARAFELI